MLKVVVSTVYPFKIWVGALLYILHFFFFFPVSCKEIIVVLGNCKYVCLWKSNVSWPLFCCGALYMALLFITNHPLLRALYFSQSKSANDCGHVLMCVLWSKKIIVFALFMILFQNNVDTTPLKIVFMMCELVWFGGWCLIASHVRYILQR